MAVLVTCKYDEDPIKNEVAILRTRSNMGFFGTKWQVLPKRISRSGPNSNFAEILCLSWLLASLMKIQSKLKALSIAQGQIGLKSLSSGQHFFHYKSMGKHFVAQGRVTPNRIVGSRPSSNFAEILCLSWLSACLMKIWSKMKMLSTGQNFPHYKSTGAFGCHGNQSFNRIWPKALCNLSLTPMMLHIKFDQDWPIGLRDIQVWKCGQWTTMTTDHCYNISSPCEPSALVS